MEPRAAKRDRADLRWIDLGRARPMEAALRRLLDDDELARADRFRFERDRADFTVTRGALRLLLAERIRAAPAALCFRTFGEGKPILEPAMPGLAFNVSHTRGRALIGLTDGVSIGVDVEARDRDVELLPLAERNFSPRETEALLALPPRNRAPLFFRIWAAREALLKARGLGIAHLAKLDLAVGEGGALRLVRFEGDPVAPASWTLVRPDLGPGYGTAAALPAPDVEVRLREWTPGRLPPSA